MPSDEMTIPPGQTQSQPTTPTGLVSLKPIAQPVEEQIDVNPAPQASMPATAPFSPSPMEAPEVAPQTSYPEEQPPGLGSPDLAGEEGFPEAAPEVVAQIEEAEGFKEAAPELSKNFELQKLNGYNLEEAAQAAAGDHAGAHARKVARIAQEEAESLQQIYRSKEISDVPAQIFGIKEQSSNPAKRLLNGDPLVTGTHGKIVSGYGTAHLRGILNRHIAEHPSTPDQVRAIYVKHLMDSVNDGEITAKQRAINFDFAQIIIGEMMLEAQAKIGKDAWEKMSAEEQKNAMGVVLNRVGIDPMMIIKARDLNEWFTYKGNLLGSMGDLIPVASELGGTDRSSDRETVRQAKMAVSLGVATPFQKEMAKQEEARELVEAYRGATVMAGAAGVVKGIIPFFMGIGATKVLSAGVRQVAIKGLERAALKATVQAGVKGFAGRAIKTGVASAGRMTAVGAGYAPLAAAGGLYQAKVRELESGGLESFAIALTKETARGGIDAAFAELSTPLKAVLGTMVKTAFKYGSKALPPAYARTASSIAQKLATANEKTRIPVVRTALKEVGFNGPINIASNEPAKLVKHALGIEEYHALTGHELMEQIVGFSIPGLTMHAVGAARLGYATAAKKRADAKGTAAGKVGVDAAFDAAKVDELIAQGRHEASFGEKKDRAASPVDAQKEVITNTFADKTEFMSPEGLAAAVVIAPDMVEKIIQPDMQPTRRVMPGEGADGWRFTNQERLTIQQGLRELVDAQAKDADLADATAKAREEFNTREMRIKDIHVDPARFQFKAAADAESGASELLKEVKVFRKEKAGVILVWKDPADGKFYVINGHHRLDLAKRMGETSMNVMRVEAKDAAEARLIGAEVNIAEGRGTSIDAAKVIREAGLTRAQMDEKGISLSESKAREGLALSKLSDKLFSEVAEGRMSVGRGIAIGEHLTDHAAQDQLAKAVSDMEGKEGKRVSDGKVTELARFAASAPSEQVSLGAGLFGEDYFVKNLMMEKAELSDSIKRMLAQDKRLFGIISKQRNADIMKRGGNVIAVDENKSISEAARNAEYIYNLHSTRVGPVSEALNEAAKQLAAGVKKEKIMPDLYQKVADAIQKIEYGLFEGKAEPKAEPKAEIEEQAIQEVGQPPQSASPRAIRNSIPPRVDNLIKSRDAYLAAAALADAARARHTAPDAAGVDQLTPTYQAKDGLGGYGKETADRAAILSSIERARTSAMLKTDGVERTVGRMMGAKLSMESVKDGDGVPHVTATLRFPEAPGAKVKITLTDSPEANLSHILSAFDDFRATARAIETTGLAHLKTDLETAKEKEAAGVAPIGGDVGQMHVAERTSYAAEDIARKDMVSAPDIIQAMKQLFNVKIYAGKTASSKSAGEYSPGEDAIVVLRQRSGDLGVITHEIFHGVDRNTNILKGMTDEMKNEIRRLDYEPEKGRDFEGFAEWWRIYLTQSEAHARAAAPMAADYFDAWMKKPENQKIRDAVEKTRELIHKYSVAQGARERVIASVKTQEGGLPEAFRQATKGKTKEEIAWGAAEATYEALFDSKLRMAQFDKLTRTKALVSSNELMSKEVSDFYRGGEQAVAHQWLMEGVDTFTGEGKELRVVKSKSGATMLEVVRGLSDDARTDFMAYLVADHLTEAMAKEGYTAAGITLADAKRVAKDMEVKHPDFVRRAKVYRRYMHDLVDAIVDAGLLSPQDGAKIKGRYQKFTSMQREIQTETQLFKHYSGGGTASAWRARSEKGSGENIIDPLQVAAAETLRVVSKIQNGMAWHRIMRQYESAKRAGNVEHLGAWIHELPTSWTEDHFSTQRVVDELIKAGVSKDAFDAISTKRTVDGKEVVTYDPAMLSYWRQDYGAYDENYNVHKVFDTTGRNRPPVSYAVNKALLAAVNDTNLWSVGKALNIQEQSAGTQLVFKVSAVPFEVGTKVTRLGSTTLNIARTGLNAFEAFCAYITNSDKLGLTVAQAAWRPLARIPAVLGAEAREVLGMEQVDPYFVVAERVGLKSSMLLGGDLTQSTNALLAAMQTHGDRTARAKQILTSPRLLGGKVISTAGAAMSASEMITRTAILKRALEMNGISTKELSVMLANGQMPPYETLVRSVNLAKDMAINFARKGTTGGAGSKAYAFYSARLAVIDQMARTLMDIRKDGQWNPQKAAVLLPLLGWTAALATAYWFMRKDDDDYKQMPGYAKMIGPTVTDGEGNPLMQIPLGDGIIPTMWRSVEAALNAIHDGDHGEAAKAALERTASSFVPPGFPDPMKGIDGLLNMVPTVAKPVASVIANLDPLSGQPIVREHEKHPRQPEFEVNARTSDASRAFASTMFGKAIGASPIKTDYLMNSWTGGEFSRFLGVNSSASRALIPFMAPGWQAKAAREFYAKKQEMDDALVSEKHGGPVRTNEQKQADYRLDHYAEVMAVLRKAQIPLRGYDEKFVYDKYLTGAAMMANGDAPLARYPNPFPADSGVPQDAREALDALLVKKIRAAIKPEPEAHAKKKKDFRPMSEVEESREVWKIHHDGAVQILRESGLSREELRDLWLAARKRGEFTKTDGDNIRRIMALPVREK